MGTNTTHYGYAVPADGDDVGGPQIGDIAQGLENIALAIANGIFGEGFLSPTDLFPTAVPGAKQVQVSPGGVFVLSASNEPILRVLPTGVTLGTADGIVGGGAAGVGIANYFFAYADILDSLLHWHIDQDNTPPAGGKLAFTAMVDPTETVSVDGLPTGRVNTRFSVERPTRRVRSVGVTGNILDSDDIIEATGTITLTLPSAVGRMGWDFEVKNIGTGTVSIAVTGGSGQTIDGSGSPSTLTTQWSSKKFYSNGANWRVI